VTDTGVLANDGLVVASGGASIDTIPGMEHTLSICAGASSARAIRDRLAALDGGRLAFGVAGNPKHRPAMRAGPLLELAFAVERQLRDEGRRARFGLDLFSPSAELGVRPGDAAVERLLARLEQIGVRLHLGCRIERFGPDRVVTDRGEIESDLTIFMPGMTGPAWLAAGELPVSASGHVAVDARARVAGLARVYAVGDCAAFPGPVWQAKQAHTAELQAEAAAANLARELRGHAPERTVRHEVINVVDNLDRAAFFYRDERGEIMLPPNPVAHYLKLGLEAKALRKYAPLKRPARGRSA
jgi:sulfide:quinone oxidoreductase